MTSQHASGGRVQSRTDVVPPVATATLVVSWGVILALRVVYMRGFGFDTDEPQHLSVIWAWVRGLVQYRDVFDNHAPLFHLLFTPVAAAVGERPEILFYMRVAMLPLSVATLWSTYAVGRATFGRAVGLWAAVFAALIPRFFLTQVEFRADALWTALWLLSLTVLLHRPLTPRRSFAAGMLLGATICTSLKTVLLLLALASAIVVTLLRDRNARPARTLGVHALAGCLGFAVVPAAVVLFFTPYGAVTAMINATITHNVLGGVTFRPWRLHRMVGFFAPIPVWWWAGTRAARSTADPGLAARRRVLVLTTFAYIILLESWWPIATRQDVEPWVPLAAIVATAAGFAVLDSIEARVPRIARSTATTAVIGGSIVLVEVLLLLGLEPPWRFSVRFDPAVLAEVLRLTRASDTIMDLKGETVFRDRPFYYTLEVVTLGRMQIGSIADTIPEQLIARGTCVAVLDDGRFPERARDFLLANYIPVGWLRVAGHLLASGSPSRQTVTFDVRVPATYAIIAGGRPVVGWLDGHHYVGQVFLSAGRHRLRIAPAADPIALVWAPAIERGFVPVINASAAAVTSR